MNISSKSSYRRQYWRVAQKLAWEPAPAVGSAAEAPAAASTALIALARAGAKPVELKSLLAAAVGANIQGMPFWKQPFDSLSRVLATIMTLAAIGIGLIMTAVPLAMVFSGSGIATLLLIPVSWGLAAVYLLLGTDIYRHGL
jgi:hypothetical protein